MVGDPGDAAPGTEDDPVAGTPTNQSLTATDAVLSGRGLLSRLRDIMAGSGQAQARLDKIVHLIATQLQADVCSCYVARPGDILELFATHGLHPDAVHHTRLRIGEGIVGDVAAHARPAAVSNVRKDPNFAYRPETGEDRLSSLCAVPILRDGRGRGVLVLQHVEPRHYVEEVIETLETVAMVVAELLSAGELVSRQEMASVGDSGLMPTRLSGLRLNGGLAFGHAVLHRRELTIRELVADDPSQERSRLRRAVAAMHSAIDQMLESTRATGVSETYDILESYRMFAADRGWLHRIDEAIGTGLTAEAAVIRVQSETRARIAQTTSDYLRERLHDFEDLTNRLLLHLSGRPAHDTIALPDAAVLVARTLGPAELFEYDPAHLRGIVLEEGAATSHVAILARALNIPVVGQCLDATIRIEALDPVVVDADNAQVFVRPAEDILEIVNRESVLRAARETRYRDLRDLPAVTRDNIAISLSINAGLLVEVPQLKALAADGIGLYRSEMAFMTRGAYPDVETQSVLYAKVIEEADGQPVVFRTLDVGGDKPLPYFPPQDEENPALGWRAVRIGLDRPAMLRLQLRALIRATGSRPLAIMFPLVSEAREFMAASRLVDMELERAVAEGYEHPSSIRLGVMVEVPALLWELPSLLPRVDFVSVGSNDLHQYLFAVDRGNRLVADRYDVLSPAFLQALHHLRVQCDDAGVPITVCGEMAGRPLEAMALIALGYRRLSMSPIGYGPVKTMVRSLDVAAVAAYLHRQRLRCAPDLRHCLAGFARDHGVSIEDVATAR